MKGGTPLFIGGFVPMFSRLFKFMADSIQKDMKLTRAEKEKETQRQAYDELMYSYPLPENIGDMKSFAIGSLTWRDVIFVVVSEGVPVLIMMAFSTLIPQWLCIVIGVVIGLPFSFLSLKHIFTGDLPVEERVKIALSEQGKTNLLNWDKTKKADGEYVDTSTQSFVPQLIFSDDSYILLPNNKGGFAVIELTVDDMSQAKNTDLVGVVRGFRFLLNRLIQENDCTPIQIMLKSVPKNLRGFISSAEHAVDEIRMKEKYVEAERADDYAALLHALDMDVAFYYRYYIVVTYREDAEHVAEGSVNTASIRRDKLKEKAMSPLNNKAKRARSADFAVGLSEEERKAYLRELNRETEFGTKNTKAALERRVDTVANSIRELGSTHTEVKAHLLTKAEMARLVYECYNTEEKNALDSILMGALEDKDTIYSVSMYKEYPELFSIRKKLKTGAASHLQKNGMLQSRD